MEISPERKYVLSMYRTARISEPPRMAIFAVRNHFADRTCRLMSQGLIRLADEQLKYWQTTNLLITELTAKIVDGSSVQRYWTTGKLASRGPFRIYVADADGIHYLLHECPTIACALKWSVSHFRFNPGVKLYVATQDGRRRTAEFSDEITVHDWARLAAQVS